MYFKQIIDSKIITEGNPSYRPIRYTGSHLSSLKRAARQVSGLYFVLTSDVCDYKKFDIQRELDKIPPWDYGYIHCYVSSDQERGDTFIVFRQMFDKVLSVQSLEDLPIKYQRSDIYRRYDPYDLIHPAGTRILTCGLPNKNPCLWTPESRKIFVFSKSGSVRSEPYDYNKEEYENPIDYPYISYEYDHYYQDYPLDIVYISNGEKNAQKNFDTLMNTDVHGANIYRVEGINNRLDAYKAMADEGDSDWFYAVFAKCEIDPNFNFEFQPDRLQGPKHYIFNALNPVNGLEYGHMGIVCYHRETVRNQIKQGLDFTLDAKHAHVPIRSCTARFNIDAWTTWRTAFREVIKLLKTDTIEARYRSHIWNTVANGDFSEQSLQGAKDATEYFYKHENDHEALMLTYEWEWLRSFYDSRYN